MWFYFFCVDNVVRIEFLVIDLRLGLGGRVGVGGFLETIYNYGNIMY